MVNLSSFLIAGLALQAQAIVFNVSVGRNGLSFEPNEIRAARDDIIEFRFWPRNHSVVAGRFNEPCVPAQAGGFYSGFFPTPADTINPQVFRVRINNSDPIVFYCSQNNGQHCKNGMYGIINPTQNGVTTLSGYGALARQAGNATSPAGGPFGGQIAANPNTSVPPSSSTTSSAPASSSTSLTSTSSRIGSATAITSPSPTRGTSNSAGGNTTATANTAPNMGAPFVGLAVAGAAALFLV